MPFDFIFPSSFPFSSMLLVFLITRAAHRKNKMKKKKQEKWKIFGFFSFCSVNCVLRSPHIVSIEPTGRWIFFVFAFGVKVRSKPCNTRNRLSFALNCKLSIFCWCICVYVFLKCCYVFQWPAPSACICYAPHKTFRTNFSFSRFTLQFMAVGA